MLSSLASHGIDLLKINIHLLYLRPIRIINGAGTLKRMRNNVYIDILVSMGELHVQDTLNEIQKFTEFIQILASYLVDKHAPIVSLYLVRMHHSRL